MYNQNRILQLDAAGNVVGLPFTVQSALMSLYGGLGWDVVDNSLWIGTVGRVFEITTTGAVIGGFVLPSPFGAGTFVDGLEFQNANTPGVSVPEPATGGLVLLALSGLLLPGARGKRTR